MAEFTFYPEFRETAPYYVGLTDIWIGDGTTPTGRGYTDENNITRYKGGVAGYLYGIYDTGIIDEIGFVSDYAAVKQYMESHGYSLDFTYADWVNLLSNMPNFVNEIRDYVNEIQRIVDTINPITNDEIDSLFN